MKISETTVHNKTRWRVFWKEAGKQNRRFFETKDDAKTFASGIKSQLKEHGESWDVLAPGVRSELIRLHQQATENGYSIAEACRFWEMNGTKTVSNLALKELVDRCIAAKTLKNNRPESIRILNTTFKQFLIGRETVQARAITTEEVTKWIASEKAKRSWSLYRVRGVVIDLTTLFNWGIKAELLSRNPNEGDRSPGN